MDLGRYVKRHLLAFETTLQSHRTEQQQELATIRGSFAAALASVSSEVTGQVATAVNARMASQADELNKLSQYLKSKPFRQSLVDSFQPALLLALSSSLGPSLLTALRS